ncbi:aldose 1-epimerase [Pedobacter sp. CAN_A7]|uniref:aldose epimerase family protein n=1 Tax=Pedobacter sp. CAN_A7 TaxID=2787722 RepID=UPI0018CAC94B
MSDNVISSTFWGNCQGQDVFLFRMTSVDGTYVELTNYGATVVSVVVPERNHQLGNVVLGFPTLQGYLLDDCYLGATIGRYANRIANGKFNIDGHEYQLETNDGPHSNHSGSAGFNSKVFGYSIFKNGISFSYLSKDGDGGFPGDLFLAVTYSWINMELVIDYTAETNLKTIVNMTNHSYFNLTAGKGNIFEQELTVFASQFLQTNSEHIPTGAILNNEEMLFNKTNIGSRLQDDGKSWKGLNTCYVLEQAAHAATDPVAELFDPASGRSLQVFTSYPGLLIYTGDYLKSEVPGHHATAYKPFDGLCLECQYFPDAINHPDFPSGVLEADELYQKRIAYKFSVK